MFADEPTRELRCLRRSRRCLQWALLMQLVACVIAVSGCRSPSALASRKTGEESIDGIRGPTERKLQQASWEREKNEAIAAGGIERIAGMKEYEAAKRLFDAGRYADAETAFKNVVKGRQNNGLSFSERVAEAFQSSLGNSSKDNFGDPVEEDALFMVAESQFMQKKYSWAQDSYDRLIERYPSTRHMDHVARRMFSIARAWMGFPDVKETDRNNVELASAELQKTNPRTGNRNFNRPGFLNVTDRTRPVFDTSGRALQALQSIWLNDASGPLADDALMLTANYHLQTGNFVEAARVYQLLREQYPDSPHFKDAYLLDSHVRLASYEGPAYDDKSLQDSRDLRETAQRLFPDLTPEQKERLESELKRIEVSEVAREWHKVEFYQSKGRGYEASVALHCNVILNRWPDSAYAERARAALRQAATQSRDVQDSPLNVFKESKPSAESPVLAGVLPQSRQTARPSTPPARRTASAPPQRSAGTATTGKTSLFGNRPAPVNQTPNLQPVTPQGSDPDYGSGY